MQNSSLGRKSKFPTLSQKAREGWGTRISTLSAQRSELNFASGFEGYVADSADQVVGGGFAIFHG
jgi:hypothetical protein